MEKVAFVTYNLLGNGSIASGWHESGNCRALVLQNTKGRGRFLNTLSSGERRDEIGILWDELQGVLPELDHVVVYVGAGGSEAAIAMAAQLAVSKVTFVLCDCGFPAKMGMIAGAGLQDAKVVLCECGGHRTMEMLFQSFMVYGALRALAPVG